MGGTNRPDNAQMLPHVTMTVMVTMDITSVEPPLPKCFLDTGDDLEKSNNFTPPVIATQVSLESSCCSRFSDRAVDIKEAKRGIISTAYWKQDTPPGFISTYQTYAQAKTVVDRKIAALGEDERLAIFIGVNGATLDRTSFYVHVAENECINPDECTYPFWNSIDQNSNDIPGAKKFLNGYITFKG